MRWSVNSPAAMNQKVIPIQPLPPSGEPPQAQSLYEAQKKIYPKSVTGLFARWRWVFVWLTQLVFYGLPWLPWATARSAPIFSRTMAALSRTVAPCPWRAASSSAT